MSEDYSFEKPPAPEKRPKEEEKEQQFEGIETREIKATGEIGKVFQQTIAYHHLYHEIYREQYNHWTGGISEEHTDEWTPRKEKLLSRYASEYSSYRNRLEYGPLDEKLVKDYISAMRDLTDGMYPSFFMLCRYIYEEKDFGGYFSPMIAWNLLTKRLFIIGKHNEKFRELSRLVLEKANYHGERLPLIDVSDLTLKNIEVAERRIEEGKPNEWKKLAILREFEPIDKALVASVGMFKTGKEGDFETRWGIPEGVDSKTILYYALSHDIPIIGSPEGGVVLSTRPPEGDENKYPLDEIAQAVIDFQQGRVILKKS